MPPHFMLQGMLPTNSQQLCCADFKTRWLGAQHNAYPPVIAGGTDATTIHYARKDKASSLALQYLQPCLPR